MKTVDPQRHAERMAHKQKIMQERIARADKEPARARAAPASACWPVRSAMA